MKGLSLTLELVIIAIVLLVTALVIMTIFGGQIAAIVGILNPWSQSMLESNLCQQSCATWCQLHTGSAETDWSSLIIKTQSNPSKSCTDVMRESLGSNADIGKCQCRGIPVSGGTTGGAKGAACTAATSPCSYADGTTKAASVLSSVCTSGTCNVVCSSVGQKTGTCN